MRRSGERRRDARHRCQIPAVVSWNKDKVPMIIQDVSVRGLHIGSEHPVPERQLIRIAFARETEWRGLVLTGMVIRLDEVEWEAYGVGVELYANSRAQVVKWQTLVDRARQNWERDSDGRRDTRRDFERIKAILEVRVNTAKELIKLYSTDISQGGMFIETQIGLDAGNVVVLDLVHPDNGQVMHLSARVVRKVKRGKQLGVAVEFLEMDKPRRDALWKFVSATIKF